MQRGSVAFTLSLALALLGGCAGPGERFTARASALGFSAARVAGEGFAHVVYGPLGARPDGGRVLHVYLDGDGTPWERGRPAADPTPALWTCPHCGGPMVVVERLTAAQIRMRAPPLNAVEVQ